MTYIRKGYKKIHGMFGTPTYSSWQSMLARVDGYSSNPIYYSAKGITVCEAWRTFTNFFADMGLRPQGTSLDRIDSNGNYEPSNCRWATPEEQAANKSNTVMLTVAGRTQPIAAWSLETGIERKKIWRRLKCGWTPEEAISTADFGYKRGWFANSKNPHVAKL